VLLLRGTDRVENVVGAVVVRGESSELSCDEDEDRPESVADVSSKVVGSSPPATADVGLGDCHTLGPIDEAEVVVFANGAGVLLSCENFDLLLERLPVGRPDWSVDEAETGSVGLPPLVESLLEKDEDEELNEAAVDLDNACEDGEAEKEEDGDTVSADPVAAGELEGDAGARLLNRLERLEVEACVAFLD
jgi:hypothetical protein